MTADSLQIWGLIALLTIVTLVSRNLFLVLPPAWQPRGRVAQALRYAPLSALLAITVPEILRDIRAAPLTPDLLLDPRLAAAVVLALVLRFTRRPVLALALGSAAFFGLGL